ncbi:MAG TPA: DUF4342 domain-containing protein [Thermomicrobiales bacterium]|nr:DUF4342 domain-containing protein [Thermomicrobiales bacterium]
MAANIDREVGAARGAGRAALVERRIREGEVRRITVKQGAHTSVEPPLTAGVVGAALAPMLAAASALAALPTECASEVERDPGRATEAAAAGEPLSAGRG